MTVKLKINIYDDRLALAGILATNGYKVSVEQELKEDILSYRDYWVIVEGKDIVIEEVRDEY